MCSRKKGKIERYNLEVRFYIDEKFPLLNLSLPMKNYTVEDDSLYFSFNQYQCICSPDSGRVFIKNNKTNECVENFFCGNQESIYEGKYCSGISKVRGCEGFGVHYWPDGKITCGYFGINKQTGKSEFTLGVMFNTDGTKFVGVCHDTEKSKGLEVNKDGVKGYGLTENEEVVWKYELEENPNYEVYSKICDRKELLKSYFKMVLSEWKYHVGYLIRGQKGFIKRKELREQTELMLINKGKELLDRTCQICFPSDSNLRNIVREIPIADNVIQEYEKEADQINTSVIRTKEEELYPPNKFDPSIEDIGLSDRFEKNYPKISQFKNKFVIVTSEYSSI
jgi:hypothetical protein